MANPTYQSGFYAPGRGTALHPELWDGCVGAWNPGLGNTGLALRDWSGNQNNGTLTNGPTWGVTDGRQALSFDGVDDEVQLASPITFTNDATVAFWFRRGSGSAQIFASGSNYGEGYWFNINGNDVYQNWGNQYGTFIGEGANYAVGSWNHVTLVRSGSNYLIYRNGLLVDNAVVAANTGTLRGFGRAYYGVGTAAKLNGQLDDTRIYKRALSANEVRTLAQRPGIAYELAPRKFYSLPAAAGNPTGILINNLQSIRLGL